MKRLFLSLVVICFCMVLHAQTMAPITWTAYGLKFNAPKGILVEEDTEETFLLNNSRFYISIQELDSEDMTKEDLNDLLKGLADDDAVQDQTEKQKWESM